MVLLALVTKKAGEIAFLSTPSQFFNGTSIPTDGKQAPGCCQRPAKCRPGQWFQLSEPPVSSATRPTACFQRCYLVLSSVHCDLKTESRVLAGQIFYCIVYYMTSYNFISSSVLFPKKFLNKFTNKFKDLPQVLQRTLSEKWNRQNK